jgi:hypothetical protein
MRENQKPIDFISSLKDEILFQQFISYAIVHLSDDPPDHSGPVLEIESINPINGNSVISYMPFSYVVELEITRVKEQLLSDIALEIVQQADLKYKAAIADYYLTEISYVASSLEGKKHLVDYPFIKEIIGSLKTTLEEKYKPQTTNNSCANTKFQWAGKTNVLITLFYDLVTGQDNKVPLLIAKKDEVKKFIKEHFTDAKGDILSPSTVDTIFTPSKVDKRAKKGDRIEIP